LKFVRSSILYLYYAGSIQHEKIIQAIAKISGKGGEEAMSTATRLMEMGKKEGKKEGIEKGKISESQEILTKFMETKFGDCITDHDIESIKSCNDITRLKAALEILLSAEDKNTVLDKLR